MNMAKPTQEFANTMFDITLRTAGGQTFNLSNDAENRSTGGLE